MVHRTDLAEYHTRLLEPIPRTEYAIHAPERILNQFLRTVGAYGESDHRGIDIL
ncbi:MAG: hypothetical protein HOC71_03625, partial [Candidatus Latescibacteria bacterium]|nr:hypothetical protein [Candidatus Latescibacterota bacterium]